MCLCCVESHGGHGAVLFDDAKVEKREYGHCIGDWFLELMACDFQVLAGISMGNRVSLL